MTIRRHNLYESREILFYLTLRELKSRYRQTLIGVAWAILQPLSMMLVFTVVFSLFVRVPTEQVPYPVFAFTGLLAWYLTANALSRGTPSIVANMNLVTKVYFPREILPLSALTASFVDFLVTLFCYTLLLVYYKVSLSMTALWAIPILMIQIGLTSGLILLASAANVFKRDITHLLPLALQLWMFASPIVYPSSLVPERVRPIYFMNPMAGIIENYRIVILHGQSPDWAFLLPAMAWSLGLLLVGYWFFKHVEMRFADVI
jgi:lipopolysaccharide transport system permease protein